MGSISYDMAGVSECWTLCRTDEMVGAKIIYLFSGGNHRFLGCTLVLSIGCRGSILCTVIFHDTGDHCAYVDLGGSSVRMAVIGMHYFYGKWNPTFLYRNRRGISLQNISGNQA